VVAFAGWRLEAGGWGQSALRTFPILLWLQPPAPSPQPILLRLEPHDVAIVRITNHRYVPGDIHHRCEKLHHALDALPIVWREILARGACCQSREQQEVEHELLIRESLFLVAS